MPKNTVIFVAILAVFAALVVGVNIGRLLHPTLTPETTTTIPSPSLTATPEPTPATTLYNGCGISLAYPQSYTKMDIETGGAFLVNDKTPTESIAIACQKGIPKPALTEDKIESIKIGSISATLYHDTSAKDGTEIEKLLFRHPKTGLDVFVSGTGNSFATIVATLEIQ